MSIDFAVKVLKMTDDIKGHYSLINQLERSATSIGAKHKGNFVPGLSPHSSPKNQNRAYAEEESADDIG